jgi:DNA excision repair protein ERCC-4
MYEECSEEHKYLLGLRREKNAFTRLIEEHAVRQSLPDGDHRLTPTPQRMPIYLGDARTESTSADAMIKTISTRFAGGRREISQEPSRVTHPTSYTLGESITETAHLLLGHRGHAGVSL